MAEGIFIVGRSLRMRKVLAQNSTAPPFPNPQIVREKAPGGLTDPAAVTVGTAESDIIRGGAGGIECPNWMFLQPYCEGPPGTSFYLNVWGYTEAGFENQPQQIVWVPFFIVQLYCQSAPIPGLSLTSYLSDSENLCDTIVPTLGGLGTGFLSTPGSGLAAFAKIDLLGAKMFFVEFAADPSAQGTPNNPIPGMNALWRPL